MHPVKMMMESKLEVHKDKTLREATEMAYKVCWFIYNNKANQCNKYLQLLMHLKGDLMRRFLLCSNAMCVLYLS